MDVVLGRLVGVAAFAWLRFMSIACIECACFKRLCDVECYVCHLRLLRVGDGNVDVSSI